MDFPYIFLLFLLLLLAYLEWREKATSQLYFKVACCIVFFFVAFRAPMNVHIGKCSIIGANAVVTHDIPPYSVAVGVPAMVIKTIRSGNLVDSEK